MNEGPFILDIDLSKQAVIEPGVENLQYKFHEKLLFAFVPDNELNSFLDKHSHRLSANLKLFHLDLRYMKWKSIIN